MARNQGKKREMNGEANYNCLRHSIASKCTAKVHASQFQAVAMMTTTLLMMNKNKKKECVLGLLSEWKHKWKIARKKTKEVYLSLYGSMGKDVNKICNNNVQTAACVCAAELGSVFNIHGMVNGLSLELYWANTRRDSVTLNALHQVCAYAASADSWRRWRRRWQRPSAVSPSCVWMMYSRNTRWLSEPSKPAVVVTRSRKIWRWVNMRNVHIYI